MGENSSSYYIISTASHENRRRIKKNERVRYCLLQYYTFVPLARCWSRKACRVTSTVHAQYLRGRRARTRRDEMGKVRAFLLGILVTSSVISEVSGGRAGWRDACEGMCGSGFVGQACAANHSGERPSHDPGDCSASCHRYLTVNY